MGIILAIVGGDLSLKRLAKEKAMIKSWHAIRDMFFPEGYGRNLALIGLLSLFTLVLIWRAPMWIPLLAKTILTIGSLTLNLVVWSVYHPMLIVVWHRKASPQRKPNQNADRILMSGLGYEDLLPLLRAGKHVGIGPQGISIINQD